MKKSLIAALIISCTMLTSCGGSGSVVPDNTESAVNSKNTSVSEPDEKEEQTDAEEEPEEEQPQATEPEMKNLPEYDEWCKTCVGEKLTCKTELTELLDSLNKDYTETASVPSGDGLPEDSVEIWQLSSEPHFYFYDPATVGDYAVPTKIILFVNKSDKAVAVGKKEYEDDDYLDNVFAIPANSAVAAYRYANNGNAVAEADEYRAYELTQKSYDDYVLAYRDTTDFPADVNKYIAILEGRDIHDVDITVTGPTDADVTVKDGGRWSESLYQAFDEDTLYGTLKLNILYFDDEKLFEHADLAVTVRDSSIGAYVKSVNNNGFGIGKNFIVVPDAEVQALPA